MHPLPSSVDRAADSCKRKTPLRALTASRHLRYARHPPAVPLFCPNGLPRGASGDQGDRNTDQEHMHEKVG